jgi:hypothetical protein
MKEVLDFNPLTGETTRFESDGEKFRIVQYQDISPILDGNKRLAADESHSRKGIKNDMWHYATIPNTVALKWKQEKGVDIFNPEHRKKMFKLLNDPEYSYLKTTTLKHGG